MCVCVCVCVYVLVFDMCVCVCVCVCVCDMHVCVCVCVHQVALMDLVPADKERGLETPVWDEYKKLVNSAEGKEASLSLITMHP